jgi:hypothetical protein
LALGLKGIQTMEFKLEFESQQTKEMHQHECTINSYISLTLF